MASIFDDEWDKSTSEIQSEDSDYLHENRPNRWKGTPQSWRTITEEERLTYNALIRLRNEDLSLHLYNAWKLKQRARRAAADEGSSQEEDVDAETGQPVRNNTWAPPRHWTAWPVPTQELPPDDFMKMADDEDEVFTSRLPDDQTPRARLEEVVSATTLRFAKQRLRQRGIAESAHQDSDNIVKTGSFASENESQPSESGNHGEDDERVDIDQESEGRQKRKQKAPVKTFKPVIATDDEASLKLIRPSTQGIVDKLDRAMTIMHYAQIPSAQHPAGDSESSGGKDGHDDETVTAAGESQNSHKGKQPDRKASRKTVTEGKEHGKHKKPNRSKPQDWQDVMNAAALAGFSPEVIARTKQRLAKVLGEGMKMPQIDETATSPGASGTMGTTYQPGGAMPSSSSKAQEDVGGLGPRQTRAASRHSSSGPSKVNFPTSDEEGGEDGPSPKKSQKRATSRGKGQHFCPYADCDRASDGFDRPFNLKRHMRLVHGKDSLEVAEKEEPATDEMLGGIHRDGFLEPIRVQKGWRAEDTKKRAKKNT